jgi:hypothetical protein
MRSNGRASKGDEPSRWESARKFTRMRDPEGRYCLPGSKCRQRDSKNGIVEIAARQSFSTVGLGILRASELVKMIPKATGFALQSPCQLGWTIWGSSSSRPQNQGLGGAPHFIPFIPVKKTSMHLHPCFPVLAIPAVAASLRLRGKTTNHHDLAT